MLFHSISYKMQITSIFTLIVFIFINVENCLTQKCTKENESKILDGSIRSMRIVGHPSVKFPESQDQLREFCKTNDKSLKLSKDYTNACYDNLGKNTLNIYFFTITNVNKKICKGKRRGDEFIKMGKCANAVKSETIKCDKKLISRMSVVRYAHDLHKIPLVCCHYHSFSKCVSEATEKIGTKLCSEKEAEIFDNFLAEQVSETIRFLCGVYGEESDKCDSMRKNQPKRPESDAALSPASHFVDIVKNIKLNP